MSSSPSPIHPRLSGVLASLLLTLPVVSAAPIFNWSATVDTGTAIADRSKAVGMMTNGDVIAVSQIGSGTGAQMRVQRLAAVTGTSVWTRDVGNAGTADDAVAIAIVPASGNAYIAARAASASNGLDWLVFKVNGADGTLGWGGFFTCLLYTSDAADE